MLYLPSAGFCLYLGTVVERLAASRCESAPTTKGEPMKKSQQRQFGGRAVLLVAVTIAVIWCLVFGRYAYQRSSKWVSNEVNCKYTVVKSLN